MKALEDRIILLTGAGGYLGTAMAQGLAQAGGFVYLCGRNASKLEKLAKEITESGGQASALPFDVSDSEAVQGALDQVRSEKGRLDVLINNAYNGKGGTLEHSTDEDFNQAYEVAVTAAAGLVRAALPLLREAAAPGASVINVASMYGLVSPDPRLYQSPESTNPPFYGAAKAALIQLSRYLACELAKDKVRVNALCPGPFPATAVQDSDPDFVKRLVDRVPLGRIGQADEVVGPTVFLASDASSYVTGATLPVDGGWTAW